MKWVTTLFLVICLLLSLPAAAVESEEAAARFHSGEMGEAVALYEAALDAQGPNADLYYNLGVVYHLMGALPEAILNFERALYLEPGDEDAALHLEVARDGLQSALLAASTERTITQGEPAELAFWRVFRTFGAQTLSWILLVSWALLFMALLVRRKLQHPGLRDGLAVTAVVFGLIAIASAGILIGQERTDEVQPAIVISPQALLYESPSDLAQGHPDEDLYGGAILLIEETRDRWLKVKLVDGEMGWVRAKAVGRVRVLD